MARGGSNLLFAAALAGLGGLVLGVVAGVARAGTLLDLIWNPRPSAWIVPPLGLAALALLLVAVEGWLVRFWSAEMRGAVAVALVAAAAPVSPAAVIVVCAAGGIVAALRR